MKSSETITQAVSALKALRPAYEGLLPFYEGLFLAQDAAQAELGARFESGFGSGAMEISKDRLAVSQREGFPLVDKTDFPIDNALSERLLLTLCRLAQGDNAILAESGSKLSRAVEEKTLATAEIFSHALKEDKGYFEHLAKRLKANPEVLAFLAIESIRPCLCVQAEQLSSHLDAETPWDSGYCPVCGSLPALSILRKEGKRFLFCGFCRHEWLSRRVFCPFCENRDQKRLHYFLAEEDPECRVDVCEKCNKYIKTIDKEKMERPFLPFLELISSLHLDMLAREQGLESGSPQWLQI